MLFSSNKRRTNTNKFLFIVLIFYKLCYLKQIISILTMKINKFVMLYKSLMQSNFLCININTCNKNYTQLSLIIKHLLGSLIKHFFIIKLQFTRLSAS